MTTSAELRSVHPAGADAEVGSTVGEARLTAVVHVRGPAVVLSFRGEADAFTMTGWRERIRSAADSGAEIVVADTNCLGFLSWRALLALAELAEQYRSRGVHICLVTQSATIVRVAALDPLTWRLPVHSTVVSAVSCAQAGLRPGAQSGIGK